MKKNKIILAGLIFAINIFALDLIETNIETKDVVIVHLFLFSLWIFSGLIQYRLFKKNNIKSVHVFFVNPIRMLFCLLFLLPTMLNYQKSENPYIYNFFIIYFIYLFSDLFFISKKEIK